MRRLFNTLLVTVCGLAAASSHADEVKCSVRTLLSVCGSGEVHLRFNTEDMSFQIRNGDIRCWGGDVFLEGQLKGPLEGARAGYLSSLYTLQVRKDGYGFGGAEREVEPYEMGSLEYNDRADFAHRPGSDPSGGVAYLKINRSEGQAFRLSDYLLECDR